MTLVRLKHPVWRNHHSLSAFLVATILVGALVIGLSFKTIRLFLADEPDPARVIGRVNRGIERGIIADVFATVACATYDPATGSFATPPRATRRP